MLDNNVFCVIMNILIEVNPMVEENYETSKYTPDGIKCINAKIEIPDDTLRCGRICIMCPQMNRFNLDKFKLNKREF